MRHRDGADAELQTHDLREQTLNLALREVKLARQRAHQRQGAWTQLTAGHTCGQRRVVLVATATADTAQSQILRHLRCDRRQIKDLVTNGLVVVHGHIAMAQRTLRLGSAHDLLVDLIIGHHGPETALVPGLRADLATALGFGRTRSTSRPVAGRRLR